MNQKWYLVVLFASFAICGVIASTVPENSVRDSLADQRVRTFTDVDKIPDRNWTTLSEALDLFDVRYLANNWTEGKYPVQEQCAKDITRYIKGLKNHEDWAVKANDASGRYTNGFLWGNSYYVGSATQCAYINEDYGRKIVKIQEKPMEEAKEFNSEPQKRHGGLTENNLWTGTRSNKSPHKLGFYMMTISVNTTLFPTTRMIYLGVCLPFSCNASDVSVIAKLAASEQAMKHSTLHKVRDQHDMYDMYEDPVFWILSGVTVVVVLLMAIGTGYDIYITRKYTRGRKVIYDLERHAKLDQLTGRSQKSLNTAFQGKVYLPVPAAEAIINGPQSLAVNNNNDHEGSLRSDSPKVHKFSVFEELLLSFSVRANVKIICDDKVGGDTISTIHGLRAISMAWVILGHTCIIIFKYSDNMEYRKIVERKFLFQTITNGAFSVDTFFFMGGLLVSFLYFRTNAKGDLNKLTQGTRGIVAGGLKFIGLLMYRFCRLTAPYMFILGVNQIVMKWFHSNSVFEPPTADHYNCPNYWWRNLLYINTLFPVDQMCMIWSWYVADDTQFYIIGAVILVLATNHFKIATFAMTTLLLSSWITTGYIALINNHMPSSDDPLALFDKIYDKPWTRLGPYLIGMSVGYFLFKTDCKIKMSKTTICIGWLLSSASLSSLLYGLYETELSPIMAASYSSLSHSVWALGLSWIVVACSTGYGGYVNSILSAPILYPVSRITYCAYLVHPLVIRMTPMNLDSPLHLGKYTMMITFFGALVSSYILSFIISVSFEAPIVSMLKILSPKKRKRIQ
ncbi:nose resistant to fluoxetine protein 6-like isoform X1 [Bombus vosnesenskii]|uniref:Nose resistant to fluoxetine protein 6-like isoform X1 n=1 Tax=Bombus vosnesenskii TaxID=207650 RepID=A0A6J3KI18_9HYME|nr:nose resistant to fluoxetine protein 6-like isoform X1 [Bombus vosnesenskii]XP_050473652.1 nose resistant to fluoxetine protein 6-like [Bombus huntii]